MTNNITPALLKYAEIIRKLITHDPCKDIATTYCVRVRPNVCPNIAKFIMLLYCTTAAQYNGDTTEWNALVCSKLVPYGFNVVGMYPYTTEDAYTYNDGYIN